MATAIINGREIQIPDQGVKGEKIIQQANPSNKPNRRAVLIKGIKSMTIQPHKLYTLTELRDKNGRPLSINGIPDRTKGASFWGTRSSNSKQIITEQVLDIASNYFKNGVRFDEDNAHWLIVDDYILPQKWHGMEGVENGKTSLAVVFPTEYPTLPPIGFYLKATITNAPNGHFYSAAFHDADKKMLEHGWKWYCVYVNNGAWSPAVYRRNGDWKFGDNLWTYFTLINEVLSSNE